MGKKLEGNGLYESSWIIPEHRAAILRQEYESNRRVKPTWMNNSGRWLNRQLLNQFVTLQVFGYFEN